MHEAGLARYIRLAGSALGSTRGRLTEEKNVRYRAIGMSWRRVVRWGALVCLGMASVINLAFLARAAVPLLSGIKQLNPGKAALAEWAAIESWGGERLRPSGHKQGRFTLIQIERLSNVSFQQWEHDIAPSFLTRPVVITDTQPKVWRPSRFSRHAIRHMCGMRPIRYGAVDCKWYEADCHSVRQANPRLVGKEWAALENVNIDELGINTVADFLDVQDRLLNQTGAHLHLHDATMAHYCPWALQLRAPKYFPYDLRYIGDLGDQQIKHETERAGRTGRGVKVQLPRVLLWLGTTSTA